MAPLNLDFQLHLSKILDPGKDFAQLGAFSQFPISDMSSENEEVLGKDLDSRPPQRSLYPTKLRPGSGQEKRTGPLSYGPIVSSIDDREARRRPPPQRRTTVGPGNNGEYYDFAGIYP